MPRRPGITSLRCSLPIRSRLLASKEERAKRIFLRSRPRKTNNILVIFPPPRVSLFASFSFSSETNITIISSSVQSVNKDSNSKYEMRKERYRKLEQKFFTRGGEKADVRRSGLHFKNPEVDGGIRRIGCYRTARDRNDRLVSHSPLVMGSWVARGEAKRVELVSARYAPIKCAQPGCQRY